ncbi:DUF4097 family beta strand repeat-containing protein [Caldifermentibacillus hisashii]|uniref:DUF4097 family beta strand repeat-containing protein n=1 Tax=Caldifermentibacillus hisashii TaxID=996558 RepID=UPI002E0CB195|nr:DUF4097 family beta strand repeat-containing protein [Caldifermentibacillus hisashii]
MRDFVKDVKNMKEERKKILEMVKTGQVSIEEAEKLLEELENMESLKEEKKAKMAEELSKIEAYKSSHEQNEKETFHQSSSTKTSTFAKEAKDTLTNLFERAMKKIKEMDLDFHHSVNVSHVFQQNENKFKDVFIEIPNGSVQLIVWDHSDVRVECEGKVYREEHPVQGKERFLENIEFRVDQEALAFLAKEKFMKVDTKVFLPQSIYNKVAIKLFNGTISGEGVKGKKINFQTSNGGIRLESCEAEKADLETVNGTINLTQCKIDDAETETMNGKVTIDGSYQKIDAETISGSISVRISKPAPQSVKLSSGAGSIHVRIANDLPVSGEVKSNFGNVQVDLSNLYKIDEKKEMIQKVIKFDTTAELQNKMYLFAESKTGSVTVQPY